jgi:hypothetical protein
MSRRIIENWYHRPGRHCASTALSDLMNFHGIPLSEPESFGIGEGLAFWYLEGLSPSRIMHFRSRDIEERFFRNMGFDFTWATAGDAAEIKSAIVRSIDKGVPVLMRTDIFHLDYYQSKTHFQGHAVVLWAYDDSGSAWVSDTEREGLTEVPLESLCKAVLKGGLMPGDKPMFALVARPPEVPDIKAVSIRAAGSNARGMLSTDGFDGYGVKGMNLAAERLVSWAGEKDRKWLARFAYQVMEKRGTGGGGFRKMYAEFVKPILLEEQARLMEEIASGWSELAGELKTISEGETPIFNKAAQMLGQQAKLEGAFFKKVVEEKLKAES